MTCRMATGKQKKRPIHSTDSDPCKPAKKTKFHSANCLVNLSPHIGLKWDQHLRRVVPEKEQVGLLWSDLAPFIKRPKHRSGLADVTYMPPATFSFENLGDILSYEVWTTCLTEDERKLLMQFLPSDTDVEENVQLLLTGENLHFGNPFLSWSCSLCYGDIHPDAVLNKEKHVKAAEKAHRIDLHNYHSKYAKTRNMVETLKKWRKRWLSCGDTENLFSENPVKKKQGIVQVAASKGGMPLKVAQSVDVSKFMSYIEISRTQLNHIKRLKQSGDGIQTKHVSRVVGDLDKFPVKPFGALMEGEQIKLREHWLNMVRKDLPAAFEVIKDRKALIEKSRKLLGLDIEEKNVSVMRKADQLLSDMRKDLGQHRACENDGRSIWLNAQLEHSRQSMLQGRNDQITSLQEDDGKTKHMERLICHIEGSNAKDLDSMVVNLTDVTSQSKQVSDVLNQYQKDVKCVDVSISCCANIPDEQNEDLTDMKLHKDGLYIQHKEISEVHYEDTTLQSCSPQNQQIKSINYTTTHTHTLDSQNVQVQDIDSIAGPSIHAHERDQDLNNLSNVIVNHSKHGISVPAEKRHPQMNTVIGGQEEAENIAMIPSCSSSLLPKSSGEHIPVKDFLDSNDHVGVKDRWQMAGLPQSYYHHPENRIYKGSNDLQVTQRYLSSGQHGSSVFTNNGIQGQQLAQISTSAFPMNNSASFMEPFLNQQSNSHLQIVKDIGRISYSLQHANSIEQSTCLHSSTNNRLVESATFPVQEQQQIDQSHTDLYVQQLHNNLYSGVRFPISGNPPVAEQNSYPAFAPVDHRYNNSSVEGGQLHNNNNMSGLESDNCLTQALPSGSNTDGSLFSAISQYRQPSVHMQPGRLSPSQLVEPGNQVLPPHNFVPRPQDTNPPFSGIYGHTQNLDSSANSHEASVASLNNMNWTNLIQQNPGMPDLSGRQFRGPWTR